MDLAEEVGEGALEIFAAEGGFAIGGLEEFGEAAKGGCHDIELAFKVVAEIAGGF